MNAQVNAQGLRPLSVGEILDASIKLYSSNARTLMGLAAVVVVPFQILSAIVLLSTVSEPGSVPRGLGGGFGTFGMQNTAVAGDAAARMGASAVIDITSVIVTVLTTAACVKAVSDAYLDHPSDIGSSLRFAARRLLSLVWLEILTFVLLGLAFIALVVPGIWLYAAWSVAVPALLIEGIRGRRALGRSFRLVRGRWWPAAGVILVANVLVGIVSGVIVGLLAALALAGGSGSVVVTVLVISFAGAVASILTRPFQAAVTTVLYYDLRVRHEGYDVALLAEQLGIEQVAGPQL
jgi:hypothetical protein